MRHLGIVMGLASRSLCIISDPISTSTAFSNHHTIVTETIVSARVHTNIVEYAADTGNEVIKSGFSKAQSMITNADRTSPHTIRSSNVSPQFKRAHHDVGDIPDQPPYYTMVLWINGYDVTIPVLKDNATDFCRSIAHDAPDGTSVSASAQELSSSVTSSVKIEISEHTELPTVKSAATLDDTASIPSDGAEISTETLSYPSVSPTSKESARTGDVSLTLSTVSETETLSVPIKSPVQSYSDDFTASSDPSKKSQDKTVTVAAKSTPESSVSSATRALSSADPLSEPLRSHIQATVTIDDTGVTTDELSIESSLTVATAWQQTDSSFPSVSTPSLESGDSEPNSSVDTISEASTRPTTDTARASATSKKKETATATSTEEHDQSSSTATIIETSTSRSVPSARGEASVLERKQASHAVRIAQPLAWIRGLLLQRRSFDMSLHDSESPERVHGFSSPSAWNKAIRNFDSSIHDSSAVEKVQGWESFEQNSKRQLPLPSPHGHDAEKAERVSALAIETPSPSTNQGEQTLSLKPTFGFDPRPRPAPTSVVDEGNPYTNTQNDLLKSFTFHNSMKTQTSSISKVTATSSPSSSKDPHHGADDPVLSPNASVPTRPGNATQSDDVKNWAIKNWPSTPFTAPLFWFVGAFYLGLAYWEGWQQARGEISYPRFVDTGVRWVGEKIVQHF